MQDAVGYPPLQARTRLAKQAMRAEKVAAVVMLAAPIVMALAKAPHVLVIEVLVGVMIFALSILLHAVTLPVEYDASFRRALPVLKAGRYLEDKDMPAARQILRAAAFTYVAAHQAISAAGADVVFCDVSMPELDGTAATKEIVTKGLATRVLVLTMHTEEEYLVPLMEAGAAGYLVKSAADRDLVDAVRAVAHGDIYVHPSAGRILARNLTKKDPAKTERERFDKLTQRERDVLRLVAQGYSAPEIGERLFISPKTVDTYKQRIQEKLGLAHRSDYVQLALKLGLLVET
jgi:DNA-binding NarL/FixJ family response regulator